MRALLTGDGDCTFTISFPTASRPACYGPGINYSNHPDGSSDHTSLPTGDLGLWSATETDGEACAAAQMNYLVDSISAKLDNMLKLFGSMACSAKKSGLELPAAGESQSVIDAMNANAAMDRITYNSAVMERLADDASGNPVYKSTLDITMTTPVGDVSTTLTLHHTPTDSDNTTYKGRIAVLMHYSSSGGGNCQSASSLSGSTEALSIGYEKVGSDDLRVEFDRGMFCGSSADPVDSSTLMIDPADKVSSSNPDGWGDDWNHGVFNLNPANGMGTTAYAWQAGYFDNATRVFNMTVNEAADGSASGVANFGYGPDAADADAGSINGFYCNWAGPNSRQTLTHAAQQQTLARAAGATVFTASDSKITYAPENSCSATVSQNFTYGTTAGTATNDVGTAADVVNNLVDLGSLNFTMPTAPSE